LDYLFYQPDQPRSKVVSIRIIDKDFATLDAAADEVLQRFGCVYARFSGHFTIITL